MTCTGPSRPAGLTERGLAGAWLACPARAYH